MEHGAFYVLKLDSFYYLSLKKLEAAAADAEDGATAFQLWVHHSCPGTPRLLLLTGIPSFVFVLKKYAYSWDWAVALVESSVACVRTWVPSSIPHTHKDAGSWVF